MTHRPAKPRARAIVKLLTKRESGPFAWVAKQFPRYRWATLRQVLTALVCPTPCVGEVNDTGWHKLCESNVSIAMAALHGETYGVLYRHRAIYSTTNRAFSDHCACGQQLKDNRGTTFAAHQVDMLRQAGEAK